VRQSKAGRAVSEEDIPPPVLMSNAATAPSRQIPSEPSSVGLPAAKAPASIEIPRPTVVNVSGGDGVADAVRPMPKPRSSVQSPTVPAANAPPVQLHTGPASDHRPTDSGNLFMSVGCHKFHYVKN